MLEDSSVDLITIAQALNWFDLADSYKEARRVFREDDIRSGRRGSCGIIAAWACGLHSVCRN